MKAFFRWWWLADALWRLGLLNVVDVVLYRLLLRLGIHPVQRIVRPVSSGPFFDETEDTNQANLQLPTQADLRYFGWYRLPTFEAPPAWHCNPFNGYELKESQLPWWQLSDFQNEVGDIKTIWEPSRFDWVLNFSIRSVVGKRSAVEKLNTWLADWCEKNPPFLGLNWKCGQEASIRLLHLAAGSLILKQSSSPSQNLLELLVTHLERIAPTVRYAMAQDNNHGTSEAAALFVGGTWLDSLGLDGQEWAITGRAWLEDRVQRLIGVQGSFSQSSLNYHRLMLDTLSFVEIWRKHWQLPDFSADYYERLRAATKWIHLMVDPETGDGPNLGANDGANLFPVTFLDYRDYRPSVQLASVLFANQCAYPTGPWDAILNTFQVARSEQSSPKKMNYIAEDGGFAMLYKGQAFALLRYPKFQFRPGQADVLHLDFWVNSENLFRDAGSYSYNTERRWMEYFSGTQSHNTIQFDQRDQMPRLSRFLLGGWLKTNWEQPIVTTSEASIFGAGYTDQWGASHRRTVELEADRLKVNDLVSGFSEKAVLRWRLIPGKWTLRCENNQVEVSLEIQQQISLLVSSDVPMLRAELVTGWESRYYLQKTELPVLEIEINQPGRLTTQVSWHS